MTIREYQKRAYIAIQPHENNKDELLNWAVGLSEECGEVMSHIKHFCWGHEELNLVEISKEMGDVLWYLSALSTILGIDFETVATLNMRKLEHRFGGVFTDEKSKDRHNQEAKFKDTEEYKELIEKLLIKGEEK